MAITYIPRAEQPLEAFRKAVNPYLQLAFQAMLQRKLQQQQTSDALKSLTPTTQDIQGQFQKSYGTQVQGTPQRVAQKAQLAQGKMGMPQPLPENIRNIIQAQKSLKGSGLGLTAQIAPGVSIKPREPSLLEQLGLIQSGIGRSPEKVSPKPIQKPVEGHKWELNPIKGKGGQIISQQWVQVPIKESINVEKQKKSIASARQLIKKLRNMRKALGSKEGITARIKGLGKRTAGLVGQAPEITAYENLRKAVFGQLARVVSGERGRLTNQDIERIEGAIPSIFSTGKEVDLQFNALEQLLKESEQVYGMQSNNEIGTLSTGLKYTIER